MSDQASLLRRVNEAWTCYKSDTHATQAKAARALGMNQSAFSQYMRGPEHGGIPLNTDFLLKFAALVNDPALAKVDELIDAPRHITPLLLKTTSGADIDAKVFIPLPRKSDTLRAFTVDQEGLPFPVGTTLVCDTLGESHEHDYVVVPTQGAPIMGTLRHLRGRWLVVPFPAMKWEAYYIKGEDSVWPVVLVHRASRGKRFGGE